MQFFQKNIVKKTLALKFPQDEQIHNRNVEWWYFNGNLMAKNGQSFSYMNTFFGLKPKKIGVPILKKIAFRKLVFLPLFIN